MDNNKRNKKRGLVDEACSSFDGPVHAHDGPGRFRFRAEELNEALAPAPKKTYTLEIIDPTGKGRSTHE
ncbi:MAG: hypothetical protein ACRED0_01375 [Gammaproteobacteria bacterium]